MNCQPHHDDDQVSVDRCFMNEALALARGVPDRTWPNPPVGAVVVRGGKVIGRGSHLGPGQPHAEPVALDEAGPEARGATLYVTLEPCNHRGRTAPCVPRILASGISRVVAAIRDPNPLVAGGGGRYLRDRGVEVIVGVQAEEALDLVWPFVVTDCFQRTYVELKTAISLDGKFAPLVEERKDSAPVYLTGSKARHDVHRRRRLVDLVLVGEGTVRADSPRLDGRLARSDADVPVAEPTAGYVDSDLSWTGGFNRESYFVFAGEQASGVAARSDIERDGGRIVFCAEGPKGLDPASILAEASALGISTMMVEGGPRLASSFLAANLIDRWVNYLAPVVIGRGIGWPQEGFGSMLPHGDFHLTRVSRFGKDLMTIHDNRSFSNTLSEVII
ncbi:MAG: bifunctional diaminohydroxyphosphoribosylaminopyrimidine deaminase/5-amino-6-(5-phosphoribosylamino)uracil reductase RibD [Gemmatimonadales bacterium]|nr:bifunctional diaminohydroxyphosphoribosylaminopyrimidine deaminase/5-amino-6-(5-phosphoribosylamino)uracil reductase RibD [Gemmatimonadales bacterium]